MFTTTPTKLPVDGPIARVRTVYSALIGLTVTVCYPRRDERGLSQSTENALLLAGAALIAGAIVAFIKNYVESRMPE